MRNAGLEDAHRGCSGVFTCNSNGQPKLIDYLFHDALLHATPMRPLPITAHTPLPSRECPSDHTPLVAEFSLAQPAEGAKTRREDR